MPPSIASRTAPPSRYSSSYPSRQVAPPCRSTSPNVWVSRARENRLRRQASPSLHPPPPPSYSDIFLTLAREDRSKSAKVSSAPAPVDSLEVDLARVKERLAARGYLPVPRARPSQTGSTRGRSPKPAIKSILKPSASTKIASRPIPACAGPIDLSGEFGICKASAEVYAAPWRSFPAREWVNEKLPIEGLDRVALRRQIEKRKLLADGVTARSVQFVQPVVSDCRIVSRWIEDLK